MKYSLPLLPALLCVSFTGCGPSPEQVAANNTAIAVTVIAQITADAPTPTHTSTPTPLPTATLTPTDAPEATQTPQPTSTPEPTATPQTRVRPADRMAMVYVPGGEFQMGSTDDEVDAAVDVCSTCGVSVFYGFCNRWHYEVEQPSHTVELDAFWIDRTEVTNAQYALCVADGDCDELELTGIWRPAGADHPVQVDWFNAAVYCEWAGARLPTEAEWEYAARGPESRIYPWGDTFEGTRLNFCDVNCNMPSNTADYDDEYADTAPVGSYPDGASWCGALDMAGNVYEWVADWYGPYPSEPQVNPTGPTSGEARVVRGGSHFARPLSVRTASRHWVEPGSDYDSSGFRCARDSA